ncbi:hypothetical protein BH10CYA1_BH10CYA1_05690 [soil metagenome]
MKYSFNIQANDGKRDYSEKLVIGAFSNEGGDTITLKLLAYLMFIQKSPRLDEDIDWSFVPDLVARNDAGELTLVVDCGSVSAKKADTIASKVRDRIDYYVFRKTVREMDEFHKQVQDKVKHVQNIKCISFDDKFVDGIGASLDRTNILEAYISEDMITVTMTNSFGKHEGYSTLHRINDSTED